VPRIAGQQRRLRRLAAPVLLSATLLMPEVAGAATAWLEERTNDDGIRSIMFRYLAAPGEVNDVRLRVETGAFRVTDSAPLDAGAGCTADREHSVVCVLASPSPDIYTGVLQMGDGDDAVAIDGGPLVRWSFHPSVSGDAGNDRLMGQSGVSLVGGDGADILTGSPSRDHLSGGSGRDVLTGGQGDDTLVGDTVDLPGRLGPAPELAADTLDGGPGEDFVSYDERTRAVVVDLAADIGGEPGEADVLRGIEHAVGGGGNDELRGDERDNRLFGEDGDDVLVGRGGDDRLDGGGAFLRAVGRNRMFGGRGDDHLAGGGVVRCGAGTDRVGLVDLRRPQPRSCELVDAEQITDGLALSAHPLVTRTRALVFRAVMRCDNGGDPCLARRLTVAVRSGRRARAALLARRRFRMPGLASGSRWARRVTLKPTVALRRRAGRLGRATAHITTQNEEGTTVWRYTVRLRHR
jgi:hypothetical protein